MGFLKGADLTIQADSMAKEFLNTGNVPSDTRERNDVSNNQSVAS